MAEWLKTALIDIVELIGGGTPKTSKAEYWGGNINWLSVKDFNNEKKLIWISSTKNALLNIVPQILMSTKQKCHRYYLLSHFFLFSKIIPII